MVDRGLSMMELALVTVELGKKLLRSSDTGHRLTIIAVIYA